ncbi:MAG: LysM peptidoglycan-binding domain-containing protein [Tepidiformaceae bacterium]
MAIRPSALFATLLALAAAGFAACGGGSGEGDAGKSSRATDPAAVPSSTPIQNATLYQIRGDTITTTGAPGASTPITGTGNAAGKKHTVAAGEFCGTIAARYGVSVEELLKANRTIDAGCTNLHLGDTLTIPVATTTTTGGGVAKTPAATATPRPGAARTYTVKANDTCADIASSYGVEVSRLLAANPAINGNCSNLSIGQLVTIPG